MELRVCAHDNLLLIVRPFRRLNAGTADTGEMKLF
jgi:hypothetical protein